MGRHGSIFVFFALSTVAIIVMQPDPREVAPDFQRSASEATRNSLTALRPTQEAAPLPVPDDVLSEIKRARQASVQQTTSEVMQTVANAPQFPIAPKPPATPVIAEEPQVAPRLEPVPQPSFLTQKASAPSNAPVASTPVRSELRDMSWSALGALQKLGHTAKTPGGEGSLINSIVRRSMAHVDNPVMGARTVTAAPKRTPGIALQPRHAPANTLTSNSGTSHIGKLASYTVKSGDNLALIALKLYGSALKTDHLLQDNPALRASPNSLRIGQVISYRTQ